MDVSIWWVLIGTAGGLCAGIVLFAVLSMASRDADFDGDSQPTTSS